jgi:hypothetical protein
VASRDEDARLEELWADLLDADLPEPELLARYAESPNSLTRDERRAIDSALSDSLAVRDEVDMLQTFDFDLLNADQRASGESGLWEAWRRALFRPLTLSLAGGAAALVTWIAVDLEEGGTSIPGSASPQAERFVATDREDSRSATDPSAALGGEALKPTPAPDRVREQLAAISPEPSASEAPLVPAPDASLDEAAPLEEEWIEQPEMLLAMNTPVYQRPTGAMDRFFDAGAYRSTGVPSTLEIEALVPAHAARAGLAAPRLFWSLNEIPADGDFYLGLVDAYGEGEIVVDGHLLEQPESPGLQALDLAMLEIALEPGREYRWSISHRADEWAAPTAFAQGSLTYAPLDSDLSARLRAAGPGEKSALLASAGYWYDALGAAIDLMAAYPEDPRPREATRSLLEQAGRPTRID